MGLLFVYPGAAANCVWIFLLLFILLFFMFYSSMKDYCVIAIKASAKSTKKKITCATALWCKRLMKRRTTREDTNVFGFFFLSATGRPKKAHTR